MSRLAFLLAVAKAQDLCNTCTCSTLNGLKIDCSGRHFTEFPSSIPASTTTLILDSNEISNIPENSLTNLPNLEIFSIVDNQLDTLPFGLFDNNSKLSQLKLSSNNLRGLPSSLFAKLSSLQLLDLKQNHLHFIQRWLFSGLTSLRFLDLSENSISLVHQTTLLDTPKLEELRLYSNKIETLPTLPESVMKLYLYDNPFLCDCVMKEFIQQAKNLIQTGAIIQEEYVVCANPPEVQHYPVFKLEPRQLVCVSPMITKVNESPVTVTSGQVLELECHAIGFPTPDITWFSPDDSIVSTRRSLYLPGINVEDAGGYRCQASNAKGKVSKYVQVYVEEDQSAVDEFLVSGQKKDCPRPCYCYYDTIDCRNKNLDTIPVGLSSITWAKSLYLSGNNLKSIHGIPSNIKHLTVDDNPLISLGATSFSHLSQIQHLSMKNCSISALPATIFTRLESLKTLILSHNPLGQIQVQTLFGLTSLQRLYMEHCKLSIVDDAAFITLYNLKYLYLQHNNLETASSAWFKGFSQNQIIKIFLKDNPWRCDCKMGGFFSLLQSQQWLEDVTEIDVIPCNSPADRRSDTLYMAGVKIIDQCPQEAFKKTLNSRILNDPNSLLEDMASEYNDLLEEEDEFQTLDEDKPAVYQPPEISPFQSQTSVSNLPQYQPISDNIPSLPQDPIVLTEKLTKGIDDFTGGIPDAAVNDMSNTIVNEFPNQISEFVENPSELNTVDETENTVEYVVPGQDIMSSDTLDLEQTEYSIQNIETPNNSEIPFVESVEEDQIDLPVSQTKLNSSEVEETALAVFDPLEKEPFISTSFKVTLAILVLISLSYGFTNVTSMRQFKFKLMLAIQSVLNNPASLLPSHRNTPEYTQLPDDEKESVYRL